MLKKLKSSNEGFTIIEVLIVLAIAGLIMLIVFLAVPSLQKNQRNTSRRSEASRVGTAADNFLSNSGGTVPASTADADKIIADAGTLAQYGTLGHNAAAAACTGTTAITTAVLSICSGPTTAATDVTAGANVDGMVLGTGVQCSGTAQFATGSTRQMALMFSLEGTGSGRTVACINL